MSSENITISENILYIERFIEVCDSSKPVEIAQLLNISYQAAKNYLQGRLPDSKVLKTISEQTPYSVNWLLTGEGSKYVKSPVNTDALILTDQFREFVRKTCLEVISEVLSNPKDSAQQKTILLNPKNIKEEKIMD